MEQWFIFVRCLTVSKLPSHAVKSGILKILPNHFGLSGFAKYWTALPTTWPGVKKNLPWRPSGPWLWWASSALRSSQHSQAAEVNCCREPRSTKAVGEKKVAKGNQKFTLGAINRSRPCQRHSWAHTRGRVRPGVSVL